MIRACLVLLSCLFVQAAFAQNAPSTRPAVATPQAQSAISPQEAQKYVAAQFGPGYKLVPNFPALIADLDGDHAEDIVLVATAKDPLIDEAAFHYLTIDPYNAFFGFGDPKVTTQFMAEEGDPRMVLIVQGWRLESPKAKFVVINLPFQSISLSRVLANKKKKLVLPCIELLDRTGLTSDLFWTGKQWKWLDKSLSMD